MIERLRTWWLSRFRPRRLAREIQREMEGHIAEEAERLVSAGRAPNAAEREARRRFGDVNRHRGMGQLAYGIEPGAQPVASMAESLRFDLAHSLRSLRQRPAVTALAVFTLATGIGGNTALFSVMNAVLFRPMPYPEAERLVLIGSGDDPDAAVVSSYPDFAEWQEQATSFSGMAVYNIATRAFTDAGTEPEEMLGAAVGPGFFDVLGVRPALGRAFTAEESLANAEPVIMLSDALWRQRYGADAGIVGQSINDGAYRVVGVMPQTFDQPEPYWDDAETLFWIPLSTSGLTNRQSRFLRVIARLAPDLDQAAAQTEISALAVRQTEEYPTAGPGGAWLVSLRDQFAGEARDALTLLLGAVAFVLLIACANVAHLMLARSMERGDEFAVRLALGASPGSLLRLQLAEGMLLSAVGALLGVVASRPAAAFLSTLAPDSMPGFGGVPPLDARVIAFALIATLATGILTSLLPGLLGVRRQRLGSATRVAGHRNAARSRRLLIGAEVALAVPLLVGAATLAQGLLQLSATDLGFRRDDVLTLRLTSRERGEASAPFFAEILEALQARAEFSEVGLVSSMPLDGLNYTGGNYVSDTGEATDASPLNAATRWVTPGYFDALDIPLLGGRTLPEGGEEDAVVVSAGFAREMWNDTDVVGRRIRGPVSDDGDTPPWRTVVGVVPDVNERGPEFEPDRMVFYPFAGSGWTSMGFMLRAAAPPAEAMAAARDTVGRLAPQVPITSFAWMNDRLRGRLADRRFRTLLLSGFAGLGLALAAIGVFGVVSYSVQRRVREIGIRIALGARTGDVSRLVVLELLGVLVAGTAVGLGLAYAAQRTLGHLVAGLEHLAPGTAFGAGVVLLLVALASAWAPARRAARVDPLTALRAN